MSALTAGIIFGWSGIALGILIGWYSRGRPTERQVSEYMSRVVDTEEVEKAQRLRKAEMVAARRSSVPRAKSVGSAKIRKVSFRRP